MQLGFVSAILPDLSLDEVLAFAAAEGFGCVEVMCWPPGKADRRYAGVCHLDVTSFGEAEAARVRELTNKHGVAISGLGYYPNPLHPNAAHRQMVAEHLKKVITAAKSLGLPVVNTFIGRDHTKSVDDNWPLMLETWRPIVKYAESCGINIGIENCPMIFTADEWPGGKNLATSPALWRRLFAELGSARLGLNIDPSHLIWLHIDYVRCVREFAKRIFHVHAKDARIDGDALYDLGVMGLGWHTPKIPGLGDVNWGAFFSALTDTGYNGPVCIEVEDRAFEGSLEDRKRSLRLSKRYLDQFVG
jgi:sugar phosphate isomerase/epimerase